MKIFFAKPIFAIMMICGIADIADAFDLLSLYHPEIVPELLEAKEDDSENGWNVRTSQKLYYDSETGRTYYYVQLVNHSSEQVYMGFARYNTRFNKMNLTWGVVGSRNKILGPIILGYTSQHKVTKIIPGTYYTGKSEVHAYDGEQHIMPVRGYWAYDFNKSMVGSYTFNLESYVVAPLEEAANHYQGGRLGRLTGGYWFWTSAEVKYPFTYTYDSDTKVMKITYKGTRVQTTPRSKLDLSDSAFENVYEDSKEALKQQFRADFPTNFYRKEREAGFKEILSDIKVATLVNTTRKVYFNDSTTLVLVNNPVDKFRVESYDIYCTDEIPVKDYYDGLFECLKNGKRYIRYLPEKKSDGEPLSDLDVMLLAEFMSSYKNVREYHDYLPQLFVWMENNFNMKGGRWLDILRAQSGTAECLKWVYLGFEVKYALLKNLSESDIQSMKYAFNNTVEFYNNWKDEIKTTRDFLELTKLTESQVLSMVKEAAGN